MELPTCLFQERVETTEINAAKGRPPFLVTDTTYTWIRYASLYGHYFYLGHEYLFVSLFQVSNRGLALCCGFVKVVVIVQR